MSILNYGQDSSIVYNFGGVYLTSEFQVFNVVCSLECDMVCKIPFLQLRKKSGAKDQRIKSGKNGV